MAIEKFLAQHLRGRFQEDVRDEIAQRLAEITVRIDTLKIEQPQQIATTQAAEFSGDALRPGTWKYRQKLQRMGETIDATSTVTLTESTHDGRAAWLLVETATGREALGHLPAVRVPSNSTHLDNS